MHSSRPLRNQGLGERSRWAEGGPPRFDPSGKTLVRRPVSAQGRLALSRHM